MEFSNYDAAKKTVTVNRPKWARRFSRFQAASICQLQWQ